MNETKAHILNVAYNMFLYNNYETVTYSEICKATKLTKGAVYHYFPSKEALFKEVVQMYLLENKLDISPVGMSLKNLLQYTVEHITTCIRKSKEIHSDQSRSPVPHHYINLLIAAYRYYPGFKEIGDKHFQNQIELWKKSITNSIKNKEIRGNINVEIIALNFISIISGLILGMIHNASTDDHLKLVKSQLEEQYKLLQI